MILLACIANSMLAVPRSQQVQPADPRAVWLGAVSRKTPPTPPSPHTAGGPHIYSSIAEALEVAEDGDVVQLLPGTHVVSQVGLLQQSQAGERRTSQTDQQLGCNVSCNSCDMCCCHHASCMYMRSLNLTGKSCLEFVCIAMHALTHYSN
jgi:hypothetical protein